MKYIANCQIFWNRKQMTIFAGQELELTPEELKECGPHHFQSSEPEKIPVKTQKEPEKVPEEREEEPKPRMGRPPKA